MADEQPSTTSKRRGRGAEASARSEALERLKARIRGGRRSDGDGYQIKLDNPIYDTVEEDEYNALVAKRREEARGFIVDDDGLGYGDEGEEEDWSKAGFTLSSDESDGETEKPKRKRQEKKDPQPKRPPSSLSAAAAMIGAQRLSSMFTSSVFKKTRDDKAKSFSCDSIVDDVIAEFAPDETDRLRRRRGPTNPSSSANTALPINNVKSEEPAIGCLDPMGGPLSSDAAANGSYESTGVVKNDGHALVSERNYGGVKAEVTKESEDGRNINSDDGQASTLQTHSGPTNGDMTEEKMLKDVEMKAEKTVKKDVFPLNAKVKEDDPALSATIGWQAAKSGGDFNVADSKVADEALNREENLEFNLEADGSLPFYILDAHEEFYGANTGTLYLFGKVIFLFSMFNFLSVTLYLCLISDLKLLSQLY